MNKLLECAEKLDKGIYCIKHTARENTETPYKVRELIAQIEIDVAELIRELEK